VTRGATHSVHNRSARRFLARAPARIDFTAGIVDAPPFIYDTVGRSVNAAISLYARAEGRLTKRACTLTASNSGIVIVAESIAKLALGCGLDLPVTIIRSLVQSSGIEVRMWTDGLPIGSRLGSSGALGVALVGLIDSLLGIDRDRIELAELSAIMEREAGIQGGKQDQYASSMGGLQFLEFSSETAITQRLILPHEKLDCLLTHLVLVHPGGSYPSSNLVRLVGDAYADGNKKVRRHMVAVNNLAFDITHAVSSADISSLSALLTEVCFHQSGIIRAVLGPAAQAASDELTSLALRSGARACKMAGGGGPGASLLVVCDPGVRRKLCAELTLRGCALLPFSFDTTGLHVSG
jgi:D-glycero-alpha-D-manno-heptose-7-phosphate kinase